MTKENLITLARSQKTTYIPNRYKILADRLMEAKSKEMDIPYRLCGSNATRKISEELGHGLKLRSVYAEEGDYNILCPPVTFVRDLDSLEQGYRIFLDWLLDEKEREEAIAPNVEQFHINHISGLMENSTYINVENLTGPGWERIPIDPRLGANAQYIHHLPHEYVITLPIYFPEMCPPESLERLDNDKKFMKTCNLYYQLRDEQGEDFIKQRLPRFPPEVDESRIQTAIRTREILDGFHEILTKYCLEKGFLK